MDPIEAAVAVGIALGSAVAAYFGAKKQIRTDSSEIKKQLKECVEDRNEQANKFAVLEGLNRELERKNIRLGERLDANQRETTKLAGNIETLTKLLGGRIHGPSD